MDYGPIVRDTDYRSPTFNQFVANPQYTGAPVAPFSPATGATVSGASAPSSTLQQLSIGLAKGTITDQAGVNKLYGNESYGSAVPEATPQTTRYTASPMAPTPASTSAPTLKAAGTTGGVAGSTPQGSLAGASSTASGMARTSSRYGLNFGGLSPEEEALTRQLETVEKPKTAEEIASEMTQGAQAEINALNENYNNQLLDQSRVNDMRSAEANAQSVLSGLTGSTEAGTRMTNVAGYNAQENKKIQDARALSLATLYRGIQNDARTEARQQQQDFRTNATSALASMKARREANVAKAEKNVVSLASSGTTIDGLKSTDPATYQYLADAVGGEAQLQAMFVLNRPKESIHDTKIQDGKYIISYENPLDGKIRIESIDLGLPRGAVQVADAGGYILFGQAGPDGKWDGNMATTQRISKTLTPEQASKNASAGTPVTSTQYANDLDAIVGNTLASIPTKFGQAAFQQQVSRARNDSDKINLIATQVLKGQPAEFKRDFSNQAVGISQIDKAIKLLDSGVQTGLVNNATQYVFNLAGKDYDPKIAQVNSYLVSAIQPYRNSVTGAAWGTQEDSEYQQLFGSTKYSPAELRQRLVQVKELLKAKSANGLNAFVNPLGTNQNVFESGALTPTGDSNVRQRAQNGGYDYAQMIADGNTEAEIDEALKAQGY